MSQKELKENGKNDDGLRQTAKAIIQQSVEYLPLGYGEHAEYLGVGGPNAHPHDMETGHGE